MDITIDQYNRCQRALATLLAFRDIGVSFDPNLTTDPPDHHAAIDAVYTFFQHCYHLKDWAAKDPNSNLTWKELEDYVKASPCLSVCADMANGSKHFGLKANEKPKSGYRVRQSGMSGTWKLGENYRLTQIDLSTGVEGDGPVWEAFALAEACMREWDRLLGDRMAAHLAGAREPRE